MVAHGHAGQVEDLFVGQVRVAVDADLADDFLSRGLSGWRGGLGRLLHEWTGFALHASSVTAGIGRAGEAAGGCETGLERDGLNAERFGIRNFVETSASR